MDLNYFRTLILVADDCPVKAGTVPAERGGKPTVASLQYALLADKPHVLTQEDILFQTWLQRQDPHAKRSAAELRRLRGEFFAKPQACLRASPLPKRYGWGVLFDQDGRAALCPMESAQYKRLAAGGDAGLTLVKAMRSQRA